MPDSDATATLATTTTADTSRPLPEGWHWARLGELCRIVRGVGFTSGEERRQPTDGYSPVLRAGNIQEHLELAGGLIYVPERYISPEQLLQEGDIVVCMSSGSPSVVGKTAQLTTIFHGAVGAFCAIIRANIPEQSTFIAYWLKSQGYLDWRDSQARGANIQNLRASELEHVPIPLPPPAEQRRIAANLAERMSAVERARAAAQAQLEAAQALPAAELRAIFESGEAQAWPRVRLGDVCSIDAPLVDPTIPEFGNLPHVNGENIESGTGNLLYLRSAIEDEMISGKYLFKPGDVLYSKLRPYLRKVTHVDFAGVCSADMYPVTTAASMYPRYLMWLLLSEDFTAYADAESRRARMPKINREQLLAWLAPAPSVDRQQQIAAVLDARVAEIARLRASLEAQLDTINELPATLLRQAFNGEL